MNVLLAFLLTIHGFSYVYLQNITVDTRVPLHIAVLIPIESMDNSCYKQAVNMAIEDVNKIPGYIRYAPSQKEFRLQPHFETTGITDGNAIESLYNLYSTGPQKISTVGPPFRDQNEFCAEYSTAQANLHISYSEPNEPVESHLLMFFQSTPSLIAGFLAGKDLMAHFNWTQVGIIYDYSETRYRKNADNLRLILQDQVRVLSVQGIWSNPAHYSVYSELNALRKQGARIIFSMVSVNGARKIFCAAYKLGMIKPKVTWILFEELPDGWASDKYNNDLSEPKQREIDCPEDILLTASRGYISIVKQGVRRDGKRNIANQTREMYVSRLKDLTKFDKCSENTAYAYDTIWILANVFRAHSLYLDLSTYAYHHFQFTIPIATRTVPLTSFEGMTGPLSYGPHPEISSINTRQGEISIFTHPNDTHSFYVGIHSKAKNLSLVDGVNSILFDDGIVPIHLPTNTTIDVSFSKSLLISMWVISFLGIILVLVIFVILFVLVKLKNYHMETPFLYVIFVLGCIMMYCSVVVYGVDTRFVSDDEVPNVCYSFVALLSLGFTLTFGPLFAKAWELYKRYMNSDVKLSSVSPVKSNKNVPEFILYLMIGTLLVVDAAVLIAWHKTSPFDIERKIIDRGAEVRFVDSLIEQYVSCSCRYETEFTVGMVSYKAFLLFFGIFLVWQTRNAKFKIKNEMKQIAMSIYNAVAVALIGGICVAVLADTTKFEATYAIVAVCICICATSTILLIFTPKLRRVIMYDPSSSNQSSERSTSKQSDEQSQYSLHYMRTKATKTTQNHTASTVTLSTQVSGEANTSPGPNTSESSSPKHIENHITSADNSTSVGSSVLSDNNVFGTSPAFIYPPDYEEKDGEIKDGVNKDGDEFRSGIYVGSHQPSGDELEGNSSTA